MTLRNCIISGVSNNGIECNWYSNGHIIEQNHISNMTNAGIYVNSNCTREIISDNVVVKNNDTLYTIYIAGTYNIVVDNQLPNMNYTNTSSGTTNSFDNNKT